MSELSLREPCLFAIAGQCVSVSSECIRIRVRVLGLCVATEVCVAAGVAVGPGPGSLPSRGQALLEALRGEVVDHGVQAAVEAGQTQRDGVEGPSEALHGTAGQGLGPHEGVEEEDGVVWDEADDEDAQVDQDHPQDASLALTAMANARRAAERPQNQGGADQVDQQGEQEAHYLGTEPQIKKAS